MWCILFLILAKRIEMLDSGIVNKMWVCIDHGSGGVNAQPRR